jgi:hypothetical protein
VHCITDATNWSQWDLRLLLLLLLGCLWLLLLLPMVLAVHIPKHVAVVQFSPSQAQPCPVVHQHLGAQP